MAAPLSPHMHFVEFCYRVADRDTLAAVDDATAEIAFHRRLHRAETGEREFRNGSVGRRYCEQLQLLISMLVNGQVPSNAPETFRHDVAPLVRRLLQKWEIGQLRQEFGDDV
jgi:hypothetical protein